MKKKNFKRLQLHKQSVSNFKERITGGLMITIVGPLCGPIPDKPGGGSDYFSCPGNDMPSCRYTDCTSS